MACLAIGRTRLLADVVYWRPTFVTVTRRRNTLTDMTGSFADGSNKFAIPVT